MRHSHPVHLCCQWVLNENSRWVYEHLHCRDEEEHYHAAAEGRSAPLLLLGGVMLLQLGVHKTQRHQVDLMILHSEEHKYENGPLSCMYI